MILFPPAKVNLGLKILRKRPDGYHDIATCMVQIPLLDVLEISASEEFQFRQTGLAVTGSAEDNLVVRAWRLLHERYGAPNAYLHLRKQIPMGAGLGGGSADATYVLKGMNSLFQLGLSDEALEVLSAELGSDCPFFVREGARMATGRGEILRPVQVRLEGYYLKLICPDLHISTAEAYAGVLPSEAGISPEEVLVRPPAEWRGQLKNDFEDSLFPKYPELAALKQSLYNEGAIYASMSGSGSAMFGLFREEPVRSGGIRNWVLPL